MCTKGNGLSLQGLGTRFPQGPKGAEEQSGRRATGLLVRVGRKGAAHGCEQGPYRAHTLELSTLLAMRQSMISPSSRMDHVTRSRVIRCRAVWSALSW